MNRRIVWMFAVLLCVRAFGAEPSTKAPEFGNEVDTVLASVALPNREDEGKWVFLITLKNTNPKKNRALMFGDKPSGWSWELKGTGDHASIEGKGRLSTRLPPGNTKVVSLSPGEVRTVKIRAQDVTGTVAPYELPAGTYRLRLSFGMPGQDNKTEYLYTNWIDFKLEAEGDGSDAPHREFPHISEGIGAKLSVPKKPAGPYAFDVTLRNFAEAPLRLFIQAATGFSFEFRPVGDATTVYQAVADVDKPDEKLPPALLAMRDKNYQAQLRASMDMGFIQPKGTRDLHVDVLDPYTAGPLHGKWKLTRRVKQGQLEKVDALPPGNYRVRAFYDPASILDTVVSFIPLNELVWRGVAVSNAIEVRLPLQGAAAQK